MNIKDAEDQEERFLCRRDHRGPQELRRRPRQSSQEPVNTPPAYTMVSFGTVTTP